MSKEQSRCARCGYKSGERACMVEEGKGPAFCPTKEKKEGLERAQALYSDAATYEFARQSSIQEAEGYIERDQHPRVRHPVKPRLQEIIEFARRMNYRKLGIAFCIGLQQEARALDQVLEKQGFEVISVACKVGCVPKEEIGIKDTEKVAIGRFEPMCNPLAQAEILNEAEVDLNILLGLCVGHDSLFIKQTRAPTTVFAVKDRLLGHNPLAAIYNLDSYYERFIKKEV